MSSHSVLLASSFNLLLMSIITLTTVINNKRNKAQSESSISRIVEQEKQKKVEVSQLLVYNYLH